MESAAATDVSRFLCRHHDLKLTASGILSLIIKIISEKNNENRVRGISQREIILEF